MRQPSKSFAPPALHRPKDGNGTLRDGVAESEWCDVLSNAARGKAVRDLDLYSASDNIVCRSCVLDFRCITFLTNLMLVFLFYYVYICGVEF